MSLFTSLRPMGRRSSAVSVAALAAALILTTSTASVATATTAAPLMGGFRESDPSHAHVHRATDEVVRTFNAQGNHAKAHGLAKIVRAQQQVVAGIKYDLTLLVQPTQCDNIEANHVPDLETACPLDTSAEPKLVAATVLWQAWADPSYTVTIKKQ